MGLIDVHRLSVGSRVQQISFSINENELLGLIGANGSGKSTLLNAMAGIEDCSGEIQLNKKNSHDLHRKQRAQTIGLLPQNNNSVWSLTVSDIVTLGRIPWGDENQEKVKWAMHSANVTAFAQRNIDELSGGEKSRVWLARVLAGEPKVILADEPIANLDIYYQLEVMRILKNYCSNGNAVLVAIHDLSLAARFCDRLCLLKNGELLAFGKPEDVLTTELLQQAYGVEVEVELKRQPPLITVK